MSGSATTVGLKNPPAVFVLSPPRSGSTLLRVMLGGHPELFAPPELELLSFKTLAERKAAFGTRNSFWLEGAVRAVMQLQNCGAEAAKEIIEQCEAKQLTTQEFYRLMQEWLGKRVLVDKTPSYALDAAILQRAESSFAEARYLHLIRHPYAMIRSFEAARLEQVFFRHDHNFSRRELAEMIWLVSQENILAFLAGVPATRQYQVRFEQLVQEPERALRGICQFLGLEYVAEMATPYSEGAQRMVDGIHPFSKMLGDVKFHEHRSVDATVAERWKTQLEPEDLLAEETWAMAERLGYRRTEAEDLMQAVNKQDQWTPLVELQRGGDRRPLFFVHPVGGNVYCYLELARQLGPEQPFYGLQARGLAENHVPLAEVSAMASYYVETLRSQWPEGPYMLGGWSMGGLIAYEMAQLLRLHGEQVNLLALVDSGPPSEKQKQELLDPRTLLCAFALDLGLSANDLTFLKDRHFGPESENQHLDRILEAAVTAKRLPVRIDRAQLLRLYNVFKINAQAVRGYFPRKSSVQVTLFKASETLSPGMDQSSQCEDPTLGWHQIAATIEVHNVPGHHFNLLRQPQVVALAEQLRACIPTKERETG